MNNNLCDIYKRIIRQEFSYLLQEYEFEFEDCEILKYGEYCNITLTSPFGKLWINFERGIPAIMVGHPRAAFDNAYLSTNDPYWYGLGSLIAYFNNEPVSQLLVSSKAEPLPHDDADKATVVLHRVMQQVEPHTRALFGFFEDDAFENNAAIFRSWERQRVAEYERLVNER